MYQYIWPKAYTQQNNYLPTDQPIEINIGSNIVLHTEVYKKNLDSCTLNSTFNVTASII